MTRVHFQNKRPVKLYHCFGEKHIILYKIEEEEEEKKEKKENVTSFQSFC